jgi:prepilin-type N-terminal cleavage/methylation domain-containing protein
MMWDKTAHESYARSRAVPSLHGPSSASHTPYRRLGFTLVELVVALAILLVVMIGILSSISFAYNSSNDTELRNTAKNVASYTLEYLRSRTVTRGTASTRLTALGITGTSTGTYGWYVPGSGAGTNADGAFPSMLDVGNLPLQSNGYPCNYTWAYVRTNKKDGDTNPGSGGGIQAGGAVIRFASKNAANPTQTYTAQPLAFTSTLQGYVSVRDMAAPASTVNPAPEDTNLARMWFSGSDVASGTYRTRVTDLTSAGAWTNLVVRYPDVYLAATSITSFTPLTGYLAKVYTTDADKVNPSKQAYDPYYTNVEGDEAGTHAYRGFRVLSHVVARTADPSTFRHVQYYDVTVTVLWMSGIRESSYELVSRIIAY